MKITYRNPLDSTDTLDVYFDIRDNDFTRRWRAELVRLLQNNMHLEKNYCFMGFAKSPRNTEYLCDQINVAIAQINTFNATHAWQDAGLADYHIDDHFDVDAVMYDASYGVDKALPNDPNSNLGYCLKHDAMNRLHRYFEDLQGEAWGLSSYYKVADFETKYAIRQLNDLCHELENYVMSYRKLHTEPYWQRPSQIMTWLQAPRCDLQDNDYVLFQDNSYNRELGGVYLHWAQVGKTHIEVYRDEDGQDVDDVVCSAISALRYYSGEFDIEWGNDVMYDIACPWHCAEMDGFEQWLTRNGFDATDPKLSLGYIKIAQCDLERSFGTTNYEQIWDKLSDHLDVYSIEIDGVVGTFDYVWSQANFKDMQIKTMIPGYIHSSR
jgi:hypothetical protein